MARTGSRAAAAACPCGSGAAYSVCCRPLHLYARDAETAEELMRSRYSAFAKGLPEYLRFSWHPSWRPDQITVDPGRRWTGLQVLGGTAGGAQDAAGTVEFVATSEAAGRVERLHEVSRFERLQGRWVYTSGDTGPAVTAS
jgi:SEC-C motif domain protein